MKLREIRIQFGIKSAKQAASLFNMPYTTYQNYETGDREPDLQTLIRFADYFGVSLDYLTGRSSYNTGKPQKFIPDTGVDCTNRIKELREQRNMTQKDLAELLFVEPHTISRYESGNISPDIEAFKIMAKHFDTSIDYIVGISDERWPAIPVAEGRLSEEEGALIHRYRKLDAVSRGKVEGYLMGILGKE